MNINGSALRGGENCTGELRLFLQSVHVNGHGARGRLQEQELERKQGNCWQGRMLVRCATECFD